MRLFADCATAANPAFGLDEASLPLVAEICRRLDGLPLAIELAAARLTHLALPALLERLEHRLPLLTTGGPDRPRRHQTMRDAIAWSYDLLDPVEQALFRRLAVFAGGFTLDAAEQVMGDREWVMGDGPPSPITHHPSPAAVLDGLASLVDKSLVRHEPGAPGGPRYFLLETVREFAAEHLRAADEEDAVREAHAAHFLDLAEAYASSLDNADDQVVLARMEAEHANVLAALEHLRWRGRAGDVARIVAALGWYWFVHGRAIETRDWLERAWESGDAAAPSTRIRLARALSAMRLARGLPDEAEACVNAGLALAREIDDASGVAAMLTRLGVINSSRGRYETAIAHLEQALALTDQLVDSREGLVLWSTARANLGVALRCLGRFAEAEDYFRQGLEGHRAARSPQGAMNSLVDLGDLARDTGNLSEAAARYREGLELAWALGEQRALIGSLQALAGVSAAKGRMNEAARWLGATERLGEVTGIITWLPLEQAAIKRGIDEARAALGEDAFGAAWVAGREQPLAETVAEARAAYDPTVQAEPAVPVRKDVVPIKLTARQREILRLLVAGRTDREIADELSIGRRTAEGHVANLLAKLGVPTRTAAASAAIAAGLVSPTVGSEHGEIP